MAIDRSILDTLMQDISPIELYEVLFQHFGSVTQTENSFLKFTYGGEAASFGIEVKEKKGRIAALRCVGNLNESEKKSIKDLVKKKIIKKTGDDVFSIIIFSNLYLSALYNYRDEFQLVPIDDENKKLAENMISRNHPVLLQIKYDGSEDHSIRFIRTYHKVQEIVLILSSLLKVNFIGPRYRGRDWVNINDGCEYLQLGYKFKETEAYKKGTFHSDDKLSQVSKVDDKNYYKYHYPDGGNEIVIPESLNEMLDIYFKELDNDKKFRFISACKWNKVSEENYTQSPFFSIGAVVNGIESLIGKTDKFNITNGSSKKKRFIQFVMSYLDNEDVTEKEVGELYDSRSRIYHDGALSINDLYGQISNGDYKTHLYRNQSYFLQEVMRKVMVGWLKNKGVWHSSIFTKKKIFFDFDKVFDSKCEESQFVILLSHIHYNLRMCSSYLLLLGGENNENVTSNLDHLMYFQSLLFAHTREAVKKISEWGEKDKIKKFLDRNELEVLMPSVSLLTKESFKDADWNEHLDNVRNRVFHYTQYKKRDELEKVIDYISKSGLNNFITVDPKAEGCKLETSFEASILGGILLQEMESLDDFKAFLKQIMPYSVEVISFAEHSIRSFLFEKGISS